MVATEIPYHALWIDGKFVDGATGERDTILNPATGETLAYVAQAQREDVNRAVAAARESYMRGAWRLASPGERTRALRRLADLIRENAEDLAQLETRNVGKPIADSRDEVGACAGCFEYYAGILPTFGGQTLPVSAMGTGLTFREPIGVCALVIPWNFPIVIAAWKVAPALAMGNSVVLKPAPNTPLTALRLGELALEAGIPSGVFNVLPGGDTVGAALVQHPDVRKISFTGSTQVGSEILRAAADDIKRVSLELGGKSANIIFADADLDKATNVFCVFGNAGQDCCARSRMLIERSVYAEFVERFIERTRQARLGDPLDPATETGSLISPEHRARVDGYVQKGKAEGAKLCIGGNAPTETPYANGSFYNMTVFSDATPNMTIVQEEIFGPVVALLPFDTEEEAIALANSTAYGLSGSLWTRDIARALRVVRAVETGVISVNTNSSVHQALPFGGVKRSGIGRDLGQAALENYSELKSVFIAAE